MSRDRISFIGAGNMAQCLIADAEHAWLELETDDVLDTLNAASIRYRIATAASLCRRQGPPPRRAKTTRTCRRRCEHR